MIQVRFALLLLFLLPKNAHAHTIEHGNSIGAVLHVDPNDSPFVLEESNIYIDFKDKTNRFRLKDCDCSISIIHEEIIVYATPLHAPEGEGNVAHLPYSFSDPGIYRIVVNGAPVLGGKFDTFTLSYPIRVNKNTSSANKQPQSRDYLWTLGITLFIGSVVVGKKLMSRKKKK